VDCRSWHLTLENAIEINRRAPPLIDLVRPISDEPAPWLLRKMPPTQL
jgi:hypothetical protein